MREIFSLIPEFDDDFLNQIEHEYFASNSVQNITLWRQKFIQLAEAVARGAGTYRQMEDHIFELKVLRFLENRYCATNLIYEPPGLNPQGNNCDLAAVIDGQSYLIEMKCFHPEWREARVPVQHIAEGNYVVMNGPAYHQYQATRGHLIERVYHTEQKISNYPNGFERVLAVPEGFHLNLEDLRDFVYIYRNGHPRRDDPLGPMTMHNIRAPFQQTIDHFWAFPFLQESFEFVPERVFKNLCQSRRSS